MELSETKIKIFCNFAAYCRNNIFVLPMKIRLFTIPNLLTLAFYIWTSDAAYLRTQAGRLWQKITHR